MCETNAPKRGVFWIIDGELYAFAYEEGKYPRALAKSQVTYTHKNLWREVCPKGCNKPYNYYPRGRVHIRQDGSVHIYLNPNITEEFLPKIKTFLELPANLKYTMNILLTIAVILIQIGAGRNEKEFCRYSKL